MDRRKRLISPCARPVEDSREIELMPGRFATSLILFDTVVIESCRLLEFPQLVSAFGFEQVIELLKSLSVKIKCDANLLAVKGSTQELVKAGKGLTFEFIMIRAADHKEYIHLCFENLFKNSGLSEKQVKKLKRAIANRLDVESGKLLATDSPELKANRSLFSDFSANAPNIKKAISMEIKEKHDILASPDDFTVRIHQLSSDTFKAETNISELMRLDEYETHEIVQSALLRLGSINQNIAEMERYTAISSLNAQNISLLEDKFDFLARELTSEPLIHEFKRIMSIREFPDLDVLAQQGRLRLDRILEIRETKQCKEFREWLTEIDSTTDEEIREQIESLRTATGNYLANVAGKSIRWLVTSGVGFIPIIGNIIGPAASALDSFLVEKIFPNSGPVSFVNRMLPSSFELNSKKGKVLTEGRDISNAV